MDRGSLVVHYGLDFTMRAILGFSLALLMCGAIRAQSSPANPAPAKPPPAKQGAAFPPVTSQMLQ